eukprot:CAMPEP_0196590094 /NCGR_PEP_ID=MMETSP1081-20130531/65556_1 /TAXON_ID=36882 /ORGANISM="Pyramimonas amylifera, Strain CCMP720" /LENGTH=235 /DNA_ID=CAMNT_0041913089 /DNA_START=111 /DNA_END=818 /DNA_ORIENTATION=+
MANALTRHQGLQNQAAVFWGVGALLLVALFALICVPFATWPESSGMPNNTIQADSIPIDGVAKIVDPKQKLDLGEGAESDLVSATGDRLGDGKEEKAQEEDTESSSNVSSGDDKDKKQIHHHHGGVMWWWLLMRPFGFHAPMSSGMAGAGAMAAGGAKAGGAMPVGQMGGTAGGRASTLPGRTTMMPDTRGAAAHSSHISAGGLRNRGTNTMGMMGRRSFAGGGMRMGGMRGFRG